MDRSSNQKMYKWQLFKSRTLDRNFMLGRDIQVNIRLLRVHEVKLGAETALYTLSQKRLL
jgi:hypothetical protein